MVFILLVQSFPVLCFVGSASEKGHEGRGRGGAFWWGRIEGILTQRESRRLLGGRPSYHQVLVGYGHLDPGLGHGLIGDCLHFGCWVEQAGVDGAA